MNNKIVKVVLVALFLVLCMFYVKYSFAWDGLDKDEIGFLVKKTGRVHPADSTLVACTRSAIDELLTMVDCIVGSTTVVIASGVEAYALPTNCMKVRKVCRKATDGGGCLDRMDAWVKGKVHEGMTAEVDDIQAWSSEIDSYMKMLWIYPVPAATDSLTVWYTANQRTSIITFGSDSSGVAIEPAGIYHPALMSLIKAYVFEYADRFDKGRYFRELSINQLNNAVQNLAQPPPEIFLAPRAVPRIP